jgi:hypothetical protein
MPGTQSERADQRSGLTQFSNELAAVVPREMSDGAMVAFATLTVTLIAVLWLIVPLHGAQARALLGSSIFLPDNLLNLSILEWGRKAIMSADKSVFDWPSGYPARETLASTESLLGWQWLYLPLRAAGVSMVGAYNAAVIASFAISAATMAMLARALGVSSRGAFVAALAFSLSHLHLALLAHFQSLAVCWLPLGLLCLHRFLETGRPGWAVGLAAAVIVTTLSSMYFGIYFLMIGAGWLVLSAVRRREWPSTRILIGLAAAAGAVVVLLSPALLPYVRFARTHGYHYPLETYTNHSAHVLGYFRVPTWLALWGRTRLAIRTPYRGVFPGLVVTALAILALRTRRAANGVPVLTVAILGAIFALLALGPVLQIFEYPTRNGTVLLPGMLLTHVPGLRMPQRLSSCVVLFLAILVGVGVDRLSRDVTVHWRRPVIALVAVALVVENWPASSLAGASAEVPAPLSLSSAYRWLHDTKPVGASVELPNADSTGFPNLQQSRYVYAAVAGHERPVVSFYGSHLPEVDSLQAAAESLPAMEARLFLLRHGVARVIVHREHAVGDRLDPQIRALRDAGFPVQHDQRDAVVFGIPTLRADAGTPIAGAR